MAKQLSKKISNRNKEDVYKTLYVLTELVGMTKTAAYKLIKPDTEAGAESLSVMASRFMSTHEYKEAGKEINEQLKKRYQAVNLDISKIGELSKDDAVKLLSTSLQVESDPKKKAEIIMLLSRLKGWDKMQEAEKETARPVLYIPFKAFKEAIAATLETLHIDTDKETFYNTFKGLFHSFKE